jgi:hypothetical protein
MNEEQYESYEQEIRELINFKKPGFWNFITTTIIITTLIYLVMLFISFLNLGGMKHTVDNVPYLVPVGIALFCSFLLRVNQVRRYEEKACKCYKYLNTRKCDKFLESLQQKIALARVMKLSGTINFSFADIKESYHYNDHKDETGFTVLEEEYLTEYGKYRELYNLKNKIIEKIEESKKVSC